jgi:hypothetical protein
MDWVFEKPLFIVIMGLLTAVILGGLWLQTGRKQAMYGLLATLVVTGLLLLVERTVQTDREQINAVLHRVAQLVERNQIDAALQYAHSNAESIRRRAKSELPQWDFHEISIKRNLEIKVDAGATPAQAVAEFNVMVVLSDASGTFQNNRVLRSVIVNFEKEGDQWRAVSYEHFQPKIGGQSQTTQ